MTFRELREHCLGKPGVTEGFPFGEEVLVFKVAVKMFALVNVERLPTPLSVKCEPAHALELRDRYPAVQPGYHLNKNHWNTVEVDGSVPDRELRAWIDDSYRLVASGLPRSARSALGLA